MNNEIKEILSLLKSSSWCNEANQIEDCITNLQDRNKELVLENISLELERNTYKSRNEKAIEYIGNGNIGIPRKTRNKFISILEGDDKQ